MVSYLIPLQNVRKPVKAIKPIRKPTPWAKTSTSGATFRKLLMSKIIKSKKEITSETAKRLEKNFIVTKSNAKTLLFFLLLAQRLCSLAINLTFEGRSSRAHEKTIPKAP